MLLNDPLAANRVIPARLYDDRGLPLSLAHVFSTDDLKLIKPDGTASTASSPPTPIVGAIDGTFNIQLAQADISQLGVVRVQLHGAGLSDWEWAELVVTSASIDTSALVAAIFAFIPDPNAPNPTFQNILHIFNVLASFLAANATGFPFSVQQQLDYKSLDTKKTRLSGAISGGARSIDAVDGT